jgi:hypothetical protein
MNFWVEYAKATEVLPVNGGCIAIEQFRLRQQEGSIGNGTDNFFIAGLAFKPSQHFRGQDSRRVETGYY